MAKKEKLTLQQELERRKVKIPNPVFYWAYNVLAHIVGSAYNPKIKVIDSPKYCDGPCFVIWNHLSRRDYLFLNLATYPRRFNMLAGYNEFFRSHLAFLFKLVNVIPKKNFSNDMVSIAGMHRIIKAGGLIAFSPEGSSSYYGGHQPIVPGTGKFLKHYGVPVYCMDLRGAYLTSHKVDITDRKGRVDATLYQLFSKEDLKNMSADEIQLKIDETFNHNDYVWNKTARVKFKTKGKAASHYDDILYKCPKCGEEFQIEAVGDTVKCKCCGNGMTIDDYYDLHPLTEDSLIPETPTDWVDWERCEIIKEIRENPDYSFTRHCKIGYLPPHELVKDKKVTSVICGEGDITIDHQGLHFKGTKLGEPYEFTMGYKELYTINIENDFNAGEVYVNGELLDFYKLPEDPSWMNKAILIVQEMHRLHVNSWKNFPWCDWMYEDGAADKFLKTWKK
ncbi:MAG: 1-acyl-sn-glycerol-3-phosphate acyltransferase [Bacilli bacterium]|nr:1-acyl-sn-glycerol-3-phosphate acyltransferase [Bacilli bacterium]